MKKILMFAAILAVAAPATAMAAPGDQRDAARGGDTARQDGKAHGNERSAAAKQRAAERRADRVNAAKTCRDEAGETEAEREAFREQYGTNENKNNAYGKCVSMQVRDSRADRAAEARQERRHAARSCLEEVKELGREEFREEYGNNRNKANAFGRCVSQTQRAAQQGE